MAGHDALLESSSMAYNKYMSDPMDKYALMAEVAIEQTFALIKPTGVSRGLVGEILLRIERKGLKFNHLELTMITEAQSRALYYEYAGTDKIEYLASYLTSGPVILLIIEGPEAIKRVRQLAGRVGTPGAIRGDFATEQKKNLFHSADSIESAARELKIFFPLKDV